MTDTNLPVSGAAKTWSGGKNLPYINAAGPRQLLRDSRVQAIMELHIEGCSTKEIQEKLKERFPNIKPVRTARIRKILSMKEIRSRIQREMQVVAERERPRNIRLRTEIRDRGLETGSSAAQQKIALEAARQLEGGTDGFSLTINGSNNNVIAGYVLKLDGEAAGPVAIANRSADGAKLLIDNDPVTDEGR